MRTPTLSQLRRVLGRALLAAPIVLACRSPETSGRARPAGDAAVAPRDAAAAAVAPDAAVVAVALDAASATGTCRHGKLDITGCGGGQVPLEESPASCGLPAKGEIAPGECAKYCGDFETRGCSVTTTRDGDPAVFCKAAHPCKGRMASTGDLRGATYADPIVDHLALARRMEAHSVFAFRELEADLARWGAPAALLRDCRRAARDEARHAAAMTRLLHARGVASEPLERLATRGFASLHALALHNEREGAVGETWGALVARHQAEHACDDDVRVAMTEIAEEETEHAALSFRIGAWARTRLGADEARALDDERRAAFAQLRATLGARPEAADALGWPTPAATAAMLAELAPLFS